VKYDVSQKPEYLTYVSELTGTKDFGPNKTIAIYSDAYELMAVVVYNGLDEKNMGISIGTSTPKWCTKVSLKLIFGFPFIQLDLNRVTAVVRETNNKSRSLVERLGFILEGEMKNFYETGESAMLYGLQRSDCRWVK